MPHFARAWSSNWKGRPKEHPRGLIHADALVRVPAWCVLARHFPSCISWSHGTTGSAGRNALGHQSSQSPLHMDACVGSSTPQRPLGPHPELPEQLSLGPSWRSEHFKRHGFRRSIAQPEGTPADASPVPSREGMHGTGRGIARFNPLRRRVTPPANPASQPGAARIRSWQEPARLSAWPRPSLRLNGSPAASAAGFAA